MGYIFDGCLLLILALSIWEGWRRGLVRALVTLVGCVAALFVAANLSTPVSEWAYDSFAGGWVENALVKSVQSTADTRIEISPQSLVGESDALADLLGDANFEPIVLEFPDHSEETVRAVIAPAMERVIRPAVVVMISWAAGLIIFLLLMVAVELLARLVDKIFHLPILRQINEIGGLIAGIGQGALWGLLFVTVVYVLALSGLLGEALTPETLSHSFLVSHLVEFSPIL